LGVGATEDEATLHQSIQVGGLYDGVAQGVQAVGPEVVGKDKYDIRYTAFLGT
jgi:hypothetical protein